MSIDQLNVKDREHQKFVESPTRAGKTAVEVVGSLQVDEILNDKESVLNAEDLEISYSWLDFGSKNERISQMIYTAASVSGVTIQRDFTYTLTGGKYRLDSEVWSVL